MEDKNIKKLIVVVTFLIIALVAILANKDVFWGGRGEFNQTAKIKGSFSFVKNVEDYMVGEENGVLKCFDGKGELKWSYRVGEEDFDIISNGKKFMAYGKGEHSIKAFDINGIKWSYNVDGDIVKVRMNNNGNSVIAYNDKNGNCVINALNVYGKEVFADKFNSGVLVDVGISNANNYFCVNQDVISDGLIYEITKYNSLGVQTEVNTIKDEGYIGGNFIGEAIMVVDTKNVYCISNGKISWKKEVDGKIKKVFDDDKYFIYQTNPNGTFFGKKNTIIVLDTSGQSILDKSIDSEISYVKSYKKGIVFSGDRDVRYLSFNGNKEYSLPLYNDVRNADFGFDSGYIIFNSDAVRVKFKEK